MPKIPVGVLGASSLVGQQVLHLLPGLGYQVHAYSRQPHENVAEDVTWHLLSPDVESLEDIGLWLSVLSIWDLPQYLPWLEACGVRRIVALSSTSCFTKLESLIESDRVVAERLAEAEAAIMGWAEQRGVSWLILRPTLIYGYGRDKNISEILRLLKRFGVFPLLGQASGLRQPIHAGDVAEFGVRALAKEGVSNRAYNISGGEVLSYREMVRRIFIGLGMRPRLLSIPLFLFRGAMFVLRFFPPFRSLTLGVLYRMNQDLVFDHGDASRDFGFEPRPFVLTPEDLGA